MLSFMLDLLVEFFEMGEWQKLGPFLQNKEAQKLKSSKNVNTKNCPTKTNSFSEKLRQFLAYYNDLDSWKSGFSFFCHLNYKKYQNFILSR